MKKFIAAIALAGTIFPVLVQADDIDKNAPIDKEIIRHEDVTGDGIKDEITVKLKAKNIMSPIEWTLIIKSNGKQIYYKHNIDGKNTDECFSDPGSDTCHKTTGFADCKRKYYYERLGVFVVNKDDYDREGILFDPAYRVKKLLERYKVGRNKAEIIINKADKIIRADKAVLVVFETSPIHSYPLEMYVEELGDFIIIYED